MAYGTPSDPVPGTFITTAYAIANILDPIRALRANTGNADPPAAQRVAVSQAPGGPTIWTQVGTDAIADAAITDAKLAANKVNRTNPIYLGFGAAAAGQSGFFDVDQPSDGPGPTALLMMQIRHWNVAADLRFQLASDINAGDQVWMRSVVGGAGTPWRRIWHEGLGTLVPSGLIGAFETAAAIPAGWSRYTAADGRVMMGAGTTFGQTFTENTNAGAGSWTHNHGPGSYLVAVQSTGVGPVESGSGSSAIAGHGHVFSGTSGDATWIPPCRVVVWARKS